MSEPSFSTTKDTKAHAGFFAGLRVLHGASIIARGIERVLAFISEWAVLATLATLAWERNWPIVLPGFDAASVPFQHILPEMRQVELTAIAAIVAYALIGWPNHARLAHGARKVFALALIGLCLLTALSTLWATHRGLAIVAAAHMAIWVAFALLIVCSDWPISRMAVFFVGGLLIEFGVGLVQVALQHFVGLGPRAGELPVRPQDNWVSVVFNGTQRWLRAYGLSSHPNVLGGHLAVGALLAYGLAITWPKVWRALIVITWAMIWALLLLTFSRSAWLATLVGGGGTALLMARGRRVGGGVCRRTVTAAITLLIGAVLLTAIFVRMFQPFLANRFEVVDNSYEALSLSEREGMNELAVKMMIAQPLTGVGAANYSTAVRAMVGYPLDWAHNVPLLIGSELGLPGLALFALMMGTLVFTGGRRWRTRSISPWQALVGGALLGLTMIMLFDHYLWTAPQGTLLWAWLAGWWMRE